MYNTINIIKPINKNIKNNTNLESTHTKENERCSRCGSPNHFNLSCIYNKH